MTVICDVHVQHPTSPPSRQGARRGEGLGVSSNSVHTFDFLYERTHSRSRHTYKNVTFSKFPMHFQSFKGLNFTHFPGEHAPPSLPLENALRGP